MKKHLIFFVIMIFAFLCATNVEAKTYELNSNDNYQSSLDIKYFAKDLDSENAIVVFKKPCEDANVLRAMRIVSYLVTAIKILIPVILIITGVISLASAVLNNDDSKIKPAVSALITKVIIGFMVAFVPTLVFGIVKTIDKYASKEKNYTNCLSCLDSVKKCDELIKKYEK